MGADTGRALSMGDGSLPFRSVGRSGKAGICWSGGRRESMQEELLLNSGRRLQAPPRPASQEFAGGPAESRRMEFVCQDQEEVQPSSRKSVPPNGPSRSTV